MTSQMTLWGADVNRRSCFMVRVHERYSRVETFQLECCRNHKPMQGVSRKDAMKTGGLTDVLSSAVSSETQQLFLCSSERAALKACQRARRMSFLGLAAILLSFNFLAAC